MELLHACVWLWKGRSSVMNYFRARPVTENLKKFKSHVTSSGWQSSVNTSVWDSSQDFWDTPWMEKEVLSVCSILMTTHYHLSHINLWMPSAQWRSPVKNICCVLTALGCTPTARAGDLDSRNWCGRQALPLVVRISYFGCFSFLPLLFSYPSPPRCIHC